MELLVTLTHTQLHTGPGSAAVAFGAAQVVEQFSYKTVPFPSRVELQTVVQLHQTVELSAVPLMLLGQPSGMVQLVVEFPDNSVEFPLTVEFSAEAEELVHTKVQI